MEKYQTGAVRDTGGKGRMDLLPMCALIRVSKHMEDAIKPDPETGVPHYQERNWEQGLPMHCMIDSALRHIAKYIDGMTDEDHLCAAATNLLMAMWTEEKRPDMQDIPSRAQDGTSLASEQGGGTQVLLSRQAQKKAKEGLKKANVEFKEGCGAYYVQNGVSYCREKCVVCKCGGDPVICDWRDNG